MNLNTAGNNAQGWAEALKVQGIDLVTNAHLKVAHEAKEYADDQSIEEAADVFISLLVSLAQTGHTVYDLAKAVHAKMIVNRGRTWEKLPDGTYQHTSS